MTAHNADKAALIEALQPHWRTDCSESRPRANLPNDYVRWVRCRCGWESKPSARAINAPDLHRIWNAHVVDALTAPEEADRG